MKDFLLGPFLGWLPILISITFFFLVSLYYFRSKNLKFLIKIVIAINIFYPLALTFIQFYIWKIDEFAKFFLPPFQSIKYFLLYSLNHFWLAPAITLILALSFYLFFNLISKFRSGIMEKPEIELGTACILILGWPLITIFLPISFVLALIMSIFSTTVLKKASISMGVPFIIAAAGTLVLGNWLVSFLFINLNSYLK